MAELSRNNNQAAETQFGSADKFEDVPLSICEKQEDHNHHTTVAIIGNGNYGKALAVRLSSAGIPLFVGSRDPSRRKFLPERANLVTYREAASMGDLVFVCIPVNTYDSVLPDLREHLEGKIVVDVSNPSQVEDPCGAWHLASLLPRSKVLKALNTISAWALESNTFGGSRETYICGDHHDAKQTLTEFLRELGFVPIDSGGLRVAGDIEQLPLKLFPEWRLAVIITLVLTLFCVIYYYIQLFAERKAGLPGFKRVALYHANRIICWIALWLFSFVYLSGAIAGFMQIYNGTKYKPFPNWLDQWMKSRKQLGLIGLLCACMHACLSLITLGAEQVSHMSVYQQIPGVEGEVFVRLHLNAEPSLLFAVLAITSFAILGITSLPTVNHRMSWMEWDYIQTRLGHIGLFFATMHVFVYVYNVYDPKALFTKAVMPPAGFFQPLLPIVVLLMKLILILPGVRPYLQRIRGGWERSPQGKASNV